MPQVSVVVPMFNGVAFLPAFFDSLSAALPQGSQVVLVDDGSTEPVWDTVPDMPAAEAIVRLRNVRNLGACLAVNRGFAAATGEIVVQLNTDLVLQPDCISAMVEVIEREQRVGIVGSKLIYPTTGLVQHIGISFGHFTKAHVFSELPAAHPLCGVTRELQATTSATAAMTRRVLDSLGPLNDDYFNVNGDVEHCLAAVELGLRNFVCADSVAYHWESQSGPARFAGLVAGEARFWSRCGERCQPDLGRFLDEALDHVAREAPELEAVPFEVVDLSRGGDRSIVLDRLDQRWPGVRARTRHAHQTSNPSDRLRLPFLLPHWVVGEPTPFIYLVDRYRELEDNRLWFETRRRTVTDELVVDLTGVVLRTSELGWGS